MAFVLTFVAMIMLTTVCAFAETKKIDYSSSITVKVVWDDENNYDGLRKSGEIKLVGKYNSGLIGIIKRTGVERYGKILVDDNSCEIDFNELPKNLKKNGERM